jgi:hypothetical protein
MLDLNYVALIDQTVSAIVDRFTPDEQWSLVRS